MKYSEQVFVVSLPRTGTTSMCKMLNVLGYKAKHVPSCFYEKWVKEGYNAFADTPCFTPTFIKERSITNPNSKFIYLDKSVDAWIDSFESVKLHESYNKLLNIKNPELLNVVNINEILAYGEVFGFNGIYDKDHFKAMSILHKRNVESLLPKDQLLHYDFTMGWEPLCKFLKKEVPLVEMPRLNLRGIIEDNYENHSTD